MRKLVRTGVAVAVIVAGSAVIAESPAAAAGADSLSFGSEARTTVGANAVVRIDGRLTYDNHCPDGIPDFIYPATDVYVVRSSPEIGGHLVDAGGGAPNTIVSTASVFTDEIIAITQPTGSLDAGTYSVVYDTCQDGDFDPDVDTIFPDVLTVKLPAVLPPASMAIVELKSAAEEEADSWLRTHALFETVEQISSIPELVDCLMSPSLDCATSIAIGKATDPLHLTANVSDQFKQLVMSESRHFAAIAADPPDDVFGQETRISALSDTAAGDGQLLNNGFADITTPLAGESALAGALLHAIERYQGAQAAGDAEWALTHAREAANLSAALAAQQRGTSAAIARLRNALSTAPIDMDAAYQAAQDYADRVWISGFTPNERRLLANLGFSSAQIAARETATRNARGDLVSRARLLAQLDELTAAHTATIAALGRARTAFDTLAADLDADPAVPDVAPFAQAGGPYDATRGVAVRLDGSGSTTPTGTSITSYDWDTDADGVFDDASGAAPSVTFSAAGARVVGLRVTNSLERHSISYSTVTVADRGHGPVIDSFDVATQNAVVTVGAPAVFSVAASDADGDPLTYTWRLDGAVVHGSGPSFTYAPAPLDVGTHILEITVSDGTGTATPSQRWEVGVVDVDRDGDGWTATADCDDASAAVNPGAFERSGNGVDDDCDAGTQDAPPGGLTGTPWAWGDNHSGQVGTGSTADEVRPPAELTGYDDIVDIDLGFVTSFAVRADGRVLAWGANNYGFLGDGTQTPRSTPVPVVGVGGNSAELTGVTQVSSGDNNQTVALRQDGSVVAWGENRNRELGDGSASDFKPFPVPVLNSDGSPLTGVREVEAGRYQSYALMSDGSVRHWGFVRCNDSRFGETVPLARPVPNLPPQVRQISSSMDASLFLMADGSVLSCGDSRVLGRDPTEATPAHKPSPVDTFGPGSGVIDISAGYESGIALKNDSSVWMWGWNGNGSMSAAGLAPGEQSITPIRVPMPPGPPVVDVEIDGGVTPTALRADGSVLIWGSDTHGSTGLWPAGPITSPTVLPLGQDAFALSASAWNGIALTRPVDWERSAFWIDASIADATTPEDGTGGFVVTLSEPAPQDLTLHWSIAPGSAGREDVNLTPGSITIPAGARSAIVPSPVLNDALDEEAETYTVAITEMSAGVNILRAQATGTVTDDDAAPTVSVEDTRVAEGSTSLTDAAVSLRLSGPSAKDVTVTLTTEDGSAAAPADYTALTAPVTIPAGRDSATAHIALHGDRVPEPDESFLVRLSDPVNASVETGQASVVIEDDDPLHFVVDSPTVIEGNSGSTAAKFIVAVEPAPPAGTRVSVPWSIVGATASVPDDVGAASGTLEFGPSSSSATVTAEVVGDTTPEPSESFRLRLGTAVVVGGRVVLPADAADALIIDDDTTTNSAPIVNAGVDMTGVEGDVVSLAASVTDPDSSPTVAWSAQPEANVDAGATCTFAAPTSEVTTVRCSDDGTYRLEITADDGVNAPVTGDLTLRLTNAAPRITNFTVDAVGGKRTATVTFDDPGIDDMACTFTWGDGSASTVVQPATSPCRTEHLYGSGTYQLTVEVTDDDGGRATAQRSLLVYVFTGFYQPVDNLPVVNVTTAGQAIPLPFSLTGYQGMDIFAAGYPASKQVSCSGSESSELPTETPGNSGLTYAAGSDRYQYVWKTQKSWGGTCRQLTMVFKDGTQRGAVFRFR